MLLIVFDRPQYRKEPDSRPSLRTLPHSTSLTKTNSLTKTLSRAISLKNNIPEFKPLEVFLDFEVSNMTFCVHVMHLTFGAVLNKYFERVV